MRKSQTNTMHKSSHWQTLTHIKPLYLDSLAALWTLCYSLGLFYALWSYWIQYILTNNILSQWAWMTVVHWSAFETLWNHIPLSTWQYIRNTVNFLMTLDLIRFRSWLYSILLPYLFSRSSFSLCKLPFTNLRDSKNKQSIRDAMYRILQ